MRKLFYLALLPLLAACDGPSVKNQAGAPNFNYNLPMADYHPRLTATDPSGWKPVPLAVEIPIGSITLPDGGLFKTALERNVHYLLSSFSVNHMLVPYRQRAGMANPPDDRPQIGFWDTDLRGANSGRFMMGAGNTLRWLNDPVLRDSLNKLIDGIEACREPNGYLLAYPHDIAKIRSEEPNYARAWVTHGLIDAAIAGNPKAYPMLRAHADFFNQWDELLPKLLHWAGNNHQGHIASTRTYLSPIGKPEDLQTAEKYYVCDWWKQELAARHDSAIWRYPLMNPHSYLVTSFSAYLDHYIATGDKSYLDASLGAWEMMHDNWEHVGGSMAICESQWKETGVDHRVLYNGDYGVVNGFAPKSYYLTHWGHTGETCGSVFWVKFNQRFHRLHPEEEKYMNEIEKTIYNVILANQLANGLIRYHTTMEGRKERQYYAANTCCEGQGTRMLGSLPEYIYSLAADGLYVNLFEPSSIVFPLDGTDVTVTVGGNFPFSPDVTVRVSAAGPVKMKLRVRVPSWAVADMNITASFGEQFSGKAGSYVTIDRLWNNDELTFTLPMALRLTEYTGFDRTPDGKRYAAEYGPVLLAAIGADEVPAHIGLSTAAQLKEALKADPDAPLHFKVADSKLTFVPYWQLKEEQRFTIYPVLDGDLKKSKK